MASYKIEWKSAAERDLKAIDKQVIDKILQAVESLAENPFPSQRRKLHYAEASCRIRVGRYRVIYEVDSEKKIVVIYHVRHRRIAYR